MYDPTYQDHSYSYYREERGYSDSDGDCSETYEDQPEDTLENDPDQPDVYSDETGSDSDEVSDDSDSDSCSDGPESENESDTGQADLPSRIGGVGSDMNDSDRTECSLKTISVDGVGRLEGEEVNSDGAGLQVSSNFQCSETWEDQPEETPVNQSDQPDVYSDETGSDSDEVSRGSDADGPYLEDKSDICRADLLSRVNGVGLDTNDPDQTHCSLKTISVDEVGRLEGQEVDSDALGLRVTLNCQCGRSRTASYQEHNASLKN